MAVLGFGCGVWWSLLWPFDFVGEGVAEGYRFGFREAEAGCAEVKENEIGIFVVSVD